MKVVITHNCFSLYWRPRLEALITLLCDRGDSVSSVAAGMPHSRLGFVDSEDAVKGGGRCIRLFDEGAEFVTPRKIYKALWRTLDDLEPDVVLAGPTAFAVGAAALAWCRASGAGIAIMDNARVEDVPRPGLVNFIKRRLYQNVGAMLLPAESHAKSYEFWGVPRDAMFYGLNVVDNEWFAEHARIARETALKHRSALGLPRKYFLGVGRQIPKKNWGGLIEAYACYRRKAGYDAWDIVLVGDGPDRETLKSRSEQLGLEGIHFAPFTPPKELCAYYALANCLVLPSSWGETWGLVVNEAMACGLPVLVSSQCGCSEILVSDSLNGWGFSPNDTQQLAGRLEEMAALDRQALAAMGGESRRIVAEWGLSRFAKGAMDAIDHAFSQRERRVNVLDRFLMRVWKGRYRLEK